MSDKNRNVKERKICEGKIQKVDTEHLTVSVVSNIIFCPLSLLPRFTALYPLPVGHWLSSPPPYLAQTLESKRVSGRPLFRLLTLWVLVPFTNSALQASSPSCSLHDGVHPPFFPHSHLLHHQSHQSVSGERERSRGMMTLSIRFFVLRCMEGDEVQLCIDRGRMRCPYVWCSRLCDRKTF